MMLMDDKRSCQSSIKTGIDISILNDLSDHSK